MSETTSALKVIDTNLQQLYVMVYVSGLGPTVRPSWSLLGRSRGTWTGQSSAGQCLLNAAASPRICSGRQTRTATGWATNRWQGFCCPCSFLCCILSPCENILFRVAIFYNGHNLDLQVVHILNRIFVHQTFLCIRSQMYTQFMRVQSVRATPTIWWSVTVIWQWPLQI